MAERATERGRSPGGQAASAGPGATSSAPEIERDSLARTRDQEMSVQEFAREMEALQQRIRDLSRPIEIFGWKIRISAS